MSEANVIAEAVHRMEQELKDVKAELITVKAECADWKHNAGVYQYDNENLKKVINRSNAKAEHYMKQNAGLTTGLKSMAQGLLDLIRSAEVHAYGDRGAPQQPGRPDRQADVTPMPRFLQAGPREAVG